MDRVPPVGEDWARGRGHPVSRLPGRMVLLSQLLVAGAIVALAVGFWHGYEMDELRQCYLERHGTIDVPEALYFDWMAARVRVPVLLAWLSLQGTSVLVFWFNRSAAGLTARQVFWTLWLMSWVGVVELTFSIVG